MDPTAAEGPNPCRSPRKRRGQTAHAGTIHPLTVGFVAESLPPQLPPRESQSAKLSELRFRAVLTESGDARLAGSVAPELYWNCLLTRTIRENGPHRELGPRHGFFRDERRSLQRPPCRAL